MYISGKIFMKIWSAVFVWLGAPLLVLGGGMHSTDDLQNVMRTFLALDLSVIKQFMKIWSVVTKIGELLYLERWRRSAHYEWFPKCKGDFPMARWIANKIFMEIWSGVIVWLGAPLLVLGGGLRSTDRVPKCNDNFLGRWCISGKIFIRCDQQLSVQNISKILWGLSWL